MSDTHSVERRDFVKIVLAFLGTVMGALIGLPAIGYLVSPATKSRQSEAWVPVGLLENYPVGVPTLFSFTRTTVNGWEKTVNSFGAYVVRSENGEAKVFSNKCTHLSCRVTWKEDAEAYLCPCHDAHFAKDGAVISGPPPEPLQAYETKIEDGNLLIHVTES